MPPWVLIGLVAVFLWAESQGEQGDLPVNVSPDDRIEQLANAIAYAENGSSLTNFRNNPGNIRDSSGAIAVYSDLTAGWQKLYNKLVFDFQSGASTIYSASMSFRALAWMWVNGTAPDAAVINTSDHPDSWAAAVAGQLGVDVNSTVGDFLNS